MRPSSSLAVALVLATSSAIFQAPLAAQPTENSQLPILKQLSIEELMELDVNLPLRREERVMDAPAAVTVLTNEDLRRQGAVSLPEALRYASGLFVARFSNSSWIVASRGFASTSSNKMLVMIDGRSVYSPLFSGVFWNQQDALLFDLERVEIIRGPGASLWGSNAVNGVINVVSRRAADTQGTVITVGGGGEEQFFTGVRYGGRAGGAGHYRVYGKFFHRDEAKLPNDVSAGDDETLGHGGFRIDLGSTPQAFTIQGDIYRTATESPAEDLRAEGENVLVRWTRRPSSRSELQVQAYYDHTYRNVPNQMTEDRDTLDLDVQHRLNLNGRHTLSGGVSYRYSADETVPSRVLAFDPEDRATKLFTAFVQDEIAITPSLMAIGGTKIERNDYTGIEWQPSARLRWMPSRSHTVWGAVSRAVRMPTRFDTDVRAFANGRLIGIGNPDFESERLIAFEAGYRTAPHPMVAIDMTAFHNRYDNLRSQERIGAAVLVDNQLNNNSTGGNVTATVQPRPWLRVTGSYTVLSHDLSLDAGSTDVYRGRFETVDPEHFGRLQARVDLPRGVELDVMAMFVGALPQINPLVPGTPGYNEMSVRAGWRLNSRVDISIIGRDVLHDQHAEFISPTSSRIIYVERAIFSRVTVAF